MFNWVKNLFKPKPKYTEEGVVFRIPPTFVDGANTLVLPPKDGLGYTLPSDLVIGEKVGEKHFLLKKDAPKPKLSAKNKKSKIAAKAVKTTKPKAKVKK